MKNQKIFSGIIFIGVGIFFFLQQTGMTLTPQFFTWPTLLMIAGIAFLAQGYIGQDFEAILPGTVLFGYGLHYHFLQSYAFFSNQAGSLVLFIGIGSLLRYFKTRSGLFQTILFLILAIFLLFYDKFTQDAGLLQNGVSIFWRFWPILLIGIGVFFLFKRKK
jgi:hypothetical protein